MRHHAFRFFLFASITYFFIASSFGASIDRFATRQPAIQWTTLESNPNGVTTRLEVDRWAVTERDGKQELVLDGLSDEQSPLPMVSFWVAVPNGRGVQAAVRDADGFTDTGLLLPEKAGMDPLVEIGNPAVFRGIRLFPVRVRPVSIDADGRVFLAENVTVETSFEGADNRAPGREEPIRVSSDMRRVLEATVANLDEVDLLEVAPVGRILVVADVSTDVRDAMEDYVQWKIEQGYEVEVESPANTGSSTQIMNLITESYENEDALPLEYILLVGDVGASVPFRMQNSSNYGDFGYTLLEGNDILAEVAIGRFSVRDLTTLRRVVHKTLAYERDVNVEDPGWLDNVVLTAGSGSGISPILTNRAIKLMFTGRGITADTLWYTMGGDIPDFIVDEVNNGAHFVNFRGYYGMAGWQNSDNDRFTNGDRLPVVTTITCGTGSFAGETTAKSEGIFRAGDGVNTLKGGVVCIGTATLSTHTRFNNVVDAGFYDGIMLRNIRTVGWSLVNAKIRLYEAYVNTSDETSSNNFAHWNNLMGDPALRMWVGIPLELDVTHPADFGQGSNYIDVTADVPAGLPDFCWATLAVDGEVLDSRMLDASGQTRLMIPDPSEYDFITLTVTGDNLVPYRSTIPREDREVFIGFDAVTFDDGPGGDNEPNPNEELGLTLTLRNTGTVPSQAYTASLTSDDPRLTMLAGGTFTVPALEPDETFTTTSEITVEVAPWTKDGCAPSLTLTVEGPEDCLSAVPVPVTAWTMTADGEPWVDDADQFILPGETTSLVLPVKNVGSRSASGLTGTLASDSDNLLIPDNTASFSDMAAGASGSNEDDPFAIQAAENASIGAKIRLILVLEDESGAVDSVHYVFYIADPRLNGAVGPDEYGYWAIDNLDDPALYNLAPVYSWLEISVIGEELDIHDTSNEDDEAILVDLPFSFSYYGEEYAHITVCTNGWLAFSNTPSIPLFRNWPIPNPNGPPGMIAPYWDDLRTSGGGVYTYYDELYQRFIIQWNCRTASNSVDQDFQVMLYNPDFWETNTDNGRIVFQYQTASYETSAGSDNDYATVGIESPDQTDGVLYAYWNNEVNPNAAPVQDGRAILFTDDLGPMGDPPSAVITPDRFDFAVNGAGSDSAALHINNEGAGNLIWSLYVINGEIDQVERLRRLRERNNATEKTGETAQVRNTRPLAEQRTSVDPLFRLLATEEKGDEGLPGPPELDRWGGPDAFGYIWRDSNEPGGPEYNWHEEYGEEVTDFTPDADDGLAGPYDLPFDFDFYGETFNQFWISSNGFLTFYPDQDPATWSNRALPSEEAPQAMIAVWWDDLDLINAEGGGTVNYWTNDADSVVVTYLDVEGWGPRGGPYTFQVVLIENNRIGLRYLDMNLPGDERLDESTIGIQNGDRDTGLTVLHNSAGYIEDELAIDLFVPRTWLSVSDYAGIVFPNDEGGSMVRVSGENVPFGLYEGTLLITTNDPLHAETEIPVTLSVVPEGEGPFVLDIPDQTTVNGVPFEPINLDEYVVDPAYPDNQIAWSYEGNEELIVQIVNRVATITPPDDEWIGSESIIFTATNPEEGTDSDTATFTVLDGNLPPTAFDLLTPADDDTVESMIVYFQWEASLDPDGPSIFYTLNVASEGDTVEYNGLVLNELIVAMDTTGLPIESFQPYDWWVTAADNEDAVTPSESVFTFHLYDLAVGETGALPETFSLGTPYPNPFNPSVSLEIALPQPTEVRVRIFDLMGREVASLAHGLLPAGWRTLTWSDPGAASGVYFIAVDAGPLHEIRKIVLMK